MILLYFLLVFFCVMACAHYLFSRRKTADTPLTFRERPLQALVERNEQPHTRDSVDATGFAKKG